MLNPTDEAARAPVNEGWRNTPYPAPPAAPLPLVVGSVVLAPAAPIALTCSNCDMNKSRFDMAFTAAKSELEKAHKDIAGLKDELEKAQKDSAGLKDELLATLTPAAAPETAAPASEAPATADAPETQVAAPIVTKAEQKRRDAKKASESVAGPANEVAVAVPEPAE